MLTGNSVNINQDQFQEIIFASTSMVARALRTAEEYFDSKYLKQVVDNYDFLLERGKEFASTDVSGRIFPDAYARFFADHVNTLQETYNAGWKAGFRADEL